MFDSKFLKDSVVLLKEASMYFKSKEMRQILNVCQHNICNIISYSYCYENPINYVFQV